MNSNNQSLTGIFSIFSPNGARPPIHLIIDLIGPISRLSAIRQPLASPPTLPSCRRLDGGLASRQTANGRASYREYLTTVSRVSKGVPMKPTLILLYPIL